MVWIKSIEVRVNWNVIISKECKREEGKSEKGMGDRKKEEILQKKKWGMWVIKKIIEKKSDNI